MKPFDIVILTDSRYLSPDPTSPYITNVLLEDQIVADELKKLGIKVTRKSWDDPSFDWSHTKCAIFRATWDYFERYQEFAQWYDKTAERTIFINSKSLIDWNIDKHYLNDLNENGINIPDTFIIEPQTKTTLEATINKAKTLYKYTSNDFVLKPCIAGGARHTYKFNVSEIDAYEKVFQQLIADEAMMLQEFQTNIVKGGEISMMVFNGEFTHAVLKIAKPGDFRVQDDYGGTVHEYKPSQEEIDFAIATVKASPELPVYARVDIFKDNNEKWALAELEIFEPELWFRFNPKAAAVLADTIKNVYFD
ncbi:RimK family alpha-L-glutamate ligase [Croceitalea marina]|uniref:RimK family alpha-L-glutamate ligase n=1 Tax=Croceitalea marina TaxID=1775166 RepID=A0ABW5MRE6_9FLAO